MASEFSASFASSLLDISDMDQSVIRDVLNDSTAGQFLTSQPFELRKARWNGETKWIQVPVDDNKRISYEDFLVAAQVAFELDCGLEVVLRDEENAVIEPALFHLFPKTTFQITPRNILTAPSDKTGDTVSVSGTSLMSSTSSIIVSEGPAAKKRKLDEDLDLIERIKASPGGNEVLTEYETNDGLTGPGRKKLVNIVVNLLVQNEGPRPTRDKKIDYAKQIVAAFPKLRDPGTAEGYKIFYDPVGRAGYIAWRLRTLNRRSGSTSSKDSMHKLKIDEKENSKPSTNVPLHNEERAQAQLIFLRNACPKTQKSEILLALQDTFHLRRSAPVKILDDFPRFFDAPYLINADFRLMYPGVEIRDFAADRILHAFEKFSRNTSGNCRNAPSGDTNQEPDWDKVTSAYVTLLKLLPPTAKGRKTEDRIKVVDAIDRLIVFHKTGTPLEDAPVKTQQPCLVAVGPNKGAVSSYFIAFEEKKLPIDATESSAAFDSLFKCHFVLAAKFDPSLSMYYEFIQDFYYKIKSSIRFTARMREVRTWFVKHDFEVTASEV